MNKKEEIIIKNLPCDYHYKDNLIKFMKFYKYNLSTSLDSIFDYFFTNLNELILNKKALRCSFSLKHNLRKLF